MYPDSPYAHPIGSFQRPQPIPTTDPDKGTQIKVCFSDVYLPYVLGALEQLLLQTTWDFETTAQLDLIQQRIFSLMYLFETASPCVKTEQISGGAEGDENMIRQNPDNPCILETSIDGTNWCKFADFSKCRPASNQPGTTHEIAEPGGGQACFPATLFANANVLLPAVVNTGDVLELTHADGAGSDGTAAFFCPSGDVYFAGNCIASSAGLSGSDPASGVFHMGLIFVINGSVFLDATAGPVTVPSGVSNGTVTLQVNDGTLSDNFGSYQVEVCLTNNGATQWSHSFTPGRGLETWTIEVINAQDCAVLTGSFEWSTADLTGGAGDQYRIVGIQKALASRTITDWDIEYSLTLGSHDAGLALRASNDAAHVIEQDFTAVATGDHVHATWHGVQTGVTLLTLNQLVSSFSQAPGGGGFSGSATVHAITIAGMLTDPF